jgi:CheY-like chemotaxis protein/Tfp pilus assembly protein PilZ
MKQDGFYRFVSASEAGDRSSDRQPARVEAVFRVSYPTVDQLVVAYSSDLSKGEPFYCTERFLPVDALVRLVLQLPEDGGDIPITCRVAYVRDNAAASATGKPAGLGLEFVDRADPCRVRIERFIASHPPLLSVRPAPPRAVLNVLIVDDDRLSLESAAASFRERGDTVRTAGNGLDALAACLKEPPGIILSDVQMPKMDGWQLLRMVRARRSLSSIPVIFLTRLGGEEERLKAYQLGVDDFLAKPCSPRLLLTRADRLMLRHAQKSQSTAQQKNLRGDLEQVSLPSVLTFLELERKTGALALTGAYTARVLIAEGRPLRVECDDDSRRLPARVLMEQLLSWATGQFEFTACDVGGTDELQCSLTTLLLEHARISDEKARG